MMGDVSQFLERGDPCAALFCLQEALLRRDRADGVDLAMRSRLLGRLGAEAAAAADLAAALEADPDAARVLAAACAMGSGPTADLLDRILSAGGLSRADRLRLCGRLELPRGPVIGFCREGGLLRVSLAGPEASVAALELHLDGEITPLDQSWHTLGQGGVLSEAVFETGAGEGAVSVRDGTGERAQHVVAAAAAPVDPSRPRRRLSVVVPVHDGLAHLPACLDSLVTAIGATPRTEAWLVDDASRDARVRELLARAGAHPRVHLITRARAGGFVAAANAGLSRAAPGPVLVLNSDTYLPRGVLARLAIHAGVRDVGTVTPLSNNAGSLTLPEPGAAARLPDPDVCDRIDAAAAALHPGGRVDVLTPNGFAMVISARARELRPGMLSSFGAGYYEEVEYGLYLRSRGLRNVAAVDCFVGHAGSASFGARRSRLAGSNLARLERSWPQYRTWYRRQAACDPLAPYRAAILARSGWQPVAPETGPGVVPRRLALGDLPVPCLPVTGALSPARLNRVFKTLRCLRATTGPVHGLEIVPSHGWRLQRLEGRAGAAALALTNGGAVEVLLQLAAGAAPSDTELRGLEPRLLERIGEAVHA